MRNLNRHPVRRAAVGVLAGTVALTGGALVVGVSPANALEGFEFERLAGINRYETAKEIAEDGWDTAETVVLASGRGDTVGTARNESNFPDALTGNYLAGSLDVPILLTNPGDLPSFTEQALVNLETENIVIVGGTDAVSQAVEDELEADGYAVTRLGGADRYDTARDVALEVGDGGANVGDAEVSDSATAILGFGQNFPDILAAGPLSYAEDLPITITRSNALPDQTAQVLEDLNIERVLIVGGTDVVSEAVKDEVEDIVGEGNTRRIDGAQRFQTAIEIAEFAYDELGFDESHINLARSDDFADALTGGPHGGEDLAPIVITLPTALHPDVEDFLTARACTLADGHIFGGTVAISQATEDAAEAAASDTSACPEAAPIIVSSDVGNNDGDTETVDMGDSFTVTFDQDVVGDSGTITIEDSDSDTATIVCNPASVDTGDSFTAALCETDGDTLTVEFLEDPVDTNPGVGDGELNFPFDIIDIDGVTAADDGQAVSIENSEDLTVEAEPDTA